LITAITAAQLLTPKEKIADPVLLVEDGIIREVGSRNSTTIPAGAKTFDFPGSLLAPSYIDLHIHGSAGYDVMEGSQDGLEKMSAFLGKRGLGGFLATTITAEMNTLLSAVERLAEQITNWRADFPGATPFGIHMEGPCLSVARRGVHPEKYIVNPSVELFDRMHKAAAGCLRLITVAPEVPGALDLIREATQRGVRVSIGHTDGDVSDAVAAIAAGATHVTHTFNAMRPLDHRRPGVLGKVLESEELSAEIIADGVHVDPIVIELFLRCKRKEKAVLVTDALSAAGMPDGTYRLGSFEFTVKGPRCEANGTLAGSVLSMDRAVRNIMQFAGWNLADSVRLGSLNPADVVGADTRGRLAKGARADVIALSPKGDVIQSFIGGIPVEA
jgi:N-acetylglucosamine-6-phosphate deacetylase